MILGNSLSVGSLFKSSDLSGSRVGCQEVPGDATNPICLSNRYLYCLGCYPLIFGIALTRWLSRLRVQPLSNNGL